MNDSLSRDLAALREEQHKVRVLILTALAAGQITYENSLAIAIGSNVGTTVTALIGAMPSIASATPTVTPLDFNDFGFAMSCVAW